MSRPTVISLFSGGGGFDIGAMQAGYEIAGAVEREKEIAKVYAANLGHRPIIDAIENVQPSQFDAAPDWLHASPPCQGNSLARVGAKEAHADLAAGIEVCRFIEAWQPNFFTLENVAGYNKNPALHAIEDCLWGQGYWVQRLTLDASDYGIPQSRVRLWVIASRLGIPTPPQPTQKKVGWYQQIEDLIPTLKESALAPWQEAKFGNQKPDTLCDLLASSNSSSAVRRKHHEPAMTVCGQKSGRPRIFFESGKVLETSLRCVADFQTFPRWYQLPDNVHRAGAIVGNAVPCQLSKLIGQSLIP